MVRRALPLSSTSANRCSKESDMSAGDLDGLVAIITGAAMGIGRSCAIQMPRQGGRVVIADIDAIAGDETRVKIGAAGGEAVFIRTDVTSMSDMEAIAKTAVDLFGSIDILQQCRPGDRRRRR